MVDVQVPAVELLGAVPTVVAERPLALAAVTHHAVAVVEPFAAVPAQVGAAPRARARVGRPVVVVPEATPTSPAGQQGAEQGGARGAHDGDQRQGSDVCRLPLLQAVGLGPRSVQVEVARGGCQQHDKQHVNVIYRNKTENMVVG